MTPPDTLAQALKTAERYTDSKPSDAQKESGNYAKGKFNWHGETISVENAKGATRSGTDKGGKQWEVKLPATYGYLRGTTAVDGDHVDCYVGDDHASKKVWVIDQVDASTKKYDEPKCMLSFESKEDALAAYEKAFSDGRAKDRIGSVTEMSIPEFRAWANSPAAKKPLAKGYATGGSVMPEDNSSAVDRALAYLRSWGSASLAQQEPNWFGRNVLGGAAKINESLPPGVGDVIMAGLLGPRMRLPAGIRVAPSPTVGRPGTDMNTLRDANLAAGQEAFHATGPTSSPANMAEFTSPSGVNEPLTMQAERQRAVWPEMYKLEKSRLRAEDKGRTVPDETLARLDRLRDVYYGRPGEQPSRQANPMYQAQKDWQAAEVPVRALSEDARGRFYDPEKMHATGGAVMPLDKSLDTARRYAKKANGGGVGRKGYADGMTVSDMTRDVTREPLPKGEGVRSPVPEWLLGQQRDTADYMRNHNSAGPVEFTEPVLPRLAAEMTGVPSIYRGAQSLGEEGIANKIKGGAEIASGLLPGASLTKAAAPLFSTLPRALLTASAPSAVSALANVIPSAQAADTAMDRMLADRTDLTKQRTAAQADLDAQTKGGGRDKDGKPIKAGRGPQYDAAAARLKALDDQLAETNAMIRTEQKRMAAREDEDRRQALAMTPTAKLKAEQERKAFEDQEAAKERGKPVRENLPGFLQDMVIPAATLAGYGLTRKIAGNANAEYARALERFMGGQKAGNLAEMALAKEQLAKLEHPGALQGLKTLGAATLPLEVRGMETAIDFAKDPNSRAYKEANDRTHDPWAMARDVGTGTISSLLAYGAGSKMAKPYVDRSLGRAIAENPNPYAAAEPLAAGYGSALRLSEDLGRLRQSGSGAPVLPAIAQGSLERPALMAPAQTTAGQLPALESFPSLAAPKSSPVPDVVYRGKDALGRTFHKDEAGLFTNNPKAPKSSNGKDTAQSAAKGKGNGKGTDQDIAGEVNGQSVFKKPEKPPGGDFGFKAGGAISRALDTARRFATGGAVRVGPMVGASGGRSDKLPVSVPAGSYIIPADTVSALGGGNTNSGFRELERAFGKAGKHPGHHPIKIMISDGEHIISPEQVAAIGGGSLERGHAALDAFIKKTRADHIRTLSSLPSPAT